MIHDNRGRKGMDLLVLQSPLILGPQTPIKIC